jgi:hypothetical protein
MKAISVLLFCGLFLFGCASSSSTGGNQKKDETVALEEAKASAEDAVKQVHDLQAEKARLEAAKGVKEEPKK